jgi:hypothetical protein
VSLLGPVETTKPPSAGENRLGKSHRKSIPVEVDTDGLRVTVELGRVAVLAPHRLGVLAEVTAVGVDAGQDEDLVSSKICWTWPAVNDVPP